MPLLFLAVGVLALLAAALAAAHSPRLLAVLCARASERAPAGRAAGRAAANTVPSGQGAKEQNRRNKRAWFVGGEGEREE